VAIAPLVVLAVLLGGVQHSLRLCTTWAHAHSSSPVQAVATQAPCHSESHADDRSSRREAPPVCCGPLAAVVSIPSGDARAALGATGGPSFLAPVARIRATGDLRGGEPVERTLARLRNHPPSPRLRPHLVFESLLV
jgi:hypothetical protein